MYCFSTRAKSNNAQFTAISMDRDAVCLENILKIEYDVPNACRQMKNTGHSFQVDANTENETSMLVLKEI